MGQYRILSIYTLERTCCITIKKLWAERFTCPQKFNADFMYNCSSVFQSQPWSLSHTMQIASDYIKGTPESKKQKNTTWLHTLSSPDRFTFWLLKLFQLLKLYTAERGRKIITNDRKEKVLKNATVTYSIILFSWFVRKEYDKARKTESGEPAIWTEFRISYVLHVSVKR
jgi:hypothetical protein